MQAPLRRSLLECERRRLLVCSLKNVSSEVAATLGDVGIVNEEHAMACTIELLLASRTDLAGAAS